MFISDINRSGAFAHVIGAGASEGKVRINSRSAWSSTTANVEKKFSNGMWSTINSLMANPSLIFEAVGVNHYRKNISESAALNYGVSLNNGALS